MNAARQIWWRFGRATVARTRFAADHSITATLSVVPGPLETGALTEKENDMLIDALRCVLTT